MHHTDFPHPLNVDSVYIISGHFVDAILFTDGLNSAAIIFGLYLTRSFYTCESINFPVSETHGP